jgi:hypothetical protein
LEILKLQQEKETMEAAFKIEMKKITKEFQLEIAELKHKLSEEKKEKYMALKEI